jgi:acetolactate decarboxylase
MKLKTTLYLIISFLIASCNQKQNAITNSDVTVIGQMKNVMMKGELFATINLDTISNKKHLFGFGPLEYLKGEILILDGKAYSSKVISDTTMLVVESYKIKAPFFAYATINEWKPIALPDSIFNLIQLENYLNVISVNDTKPYLFKLEGQIDSAKVHVVNLPEGTIVQSPDEAHQGLKHYHLQNETVDIIGFYSTKHQTIFTHHTTNLHLHLITKDRTKMGHLEEVNFKPQNIKLFIQEK